MKPKIVVVGSLNVDHTLRVPRIPGPGETLSASGAFTCFGGKGANQAVAAARAGGDVTLIGCAGRDDFGARYVQHLQGEGIATQAIVQSDLPTGSAFIAVDDRGENCIIVNPGANHALLPEHIDRHAEVIREARALLLQLECPLPAVKRAAEVAREAGVRVMVNPSPWSEAFVSAEIPVDVLIVNEHEAGLLTGMTFTELVHKPEAALAESKCSLLIVTRGSDSTLVVRSGHEVVEVAPPKIAPVDTVGAGDTFAGALAVALSEGVAVNEAVRFANAAGALATLKPGAQPAIPTRELILAMQAKVRL